MEVVSSFSGLDRETNFDWLFVKIMEDRSCWDLYPKKFWTNTCRKHLNLKYLSSLESLVFYFSLILNIKVWFHQFFLRTVQLHFFRIKMCAVDEEYVAWRKMTLSIWLECSLKFSSQDAFRLFITALNRTDYEWVVEIF